MKEAFEKIIENELLFTRLSTEQFAHNSDVKRKNVKEYLTKNSVEIRRVINETNALISENISFFLKDPTSITKEQALEFQEFAEKLSGYKVSIDTGLSYDLRDALTKYAQFVNDDDMYINNMFYKGIALFYLDRMLFKSNMSECYDNVIKFSVDYDKLNKESRNLIARAYGNSYISNPTSEVEEFYKRYERAKQFWENIAIKEDDDFNLNAYLQNLHDNYCSTTLTISRSIHRDRLTSDNKKQLLEYAKNLYDAAVKNELLDSHDYTSTQAKYVYYYEAAKYYNGINSNWQLINALYDLYKQADDDYSYDDIFKKLHVGGLFLLYLHEAPPEDFSDSEKERIAAEIEGDVFDYIRKIPDDMASAHITAMITNFALGSKDAFKDTSYLNLLLALTVFRHLPTYVHSIMVAKISHTITEYLIKFAPEVLIGLPGIATKEDVKNKADEILMFVWYAGLIHDIGKISYSHLVSFYVRKLNDREFEMIKQHSSKAEGFLKTSYNLSIDRVIYENSSKNVESMQLKNNPELFVCLGDVALGHHKSYDGKFGYPDDFNNLESPVKLIIDMISIADSIDAATDSVGRSYANEKFLCDMEEDLMSQINTRYNPVLTKVVFENKKLYDEIDKILNEYRYDIYYSCFIKSDFSTIKKLPTNSTF